MSIRSTAGSDTVVSTYQALAAGKTCLRLRHRLRRCPVGGASGLALVLHQCQHVCGGERVARAIGVDGCHLQPVNI